MSNDHDWLKLIEISGPFVAVPVLNAVFATGLDGIPRGTGPRVRSTYEEWQDAISNEAPDADAVHEAWIDHVLADLLEFEAPHLKSGSDIPEGIAVRLPEHGIDIRPDMVLVDTSSGDAALLLIDVLAPMADLEETVQIDGWVTTPVERMITLLRGSDCPIGLVTNGEKWMLIHAPVGEVVGQATWYARLWMQETETLRAFISLLRIGRFFGSPDDKLPALYERSKGHQDDVTDALGDQVARAIEVLVRSLDRADEERNRELLKDVVPSRLYEAGLTVMMRLVFLLAAEERELILLGDPTYDAFYSASNLRRQLRAKSEERLDHEHEAWSRLLALFRMVYGGVEHPALRLPALGGSLFDPDRFPFLEGRASGTSWTTEPASPLPIDDRTVLLLLDAIQLFQGRSLSYKGLDVEQIGHVYEGLLEKTVRRLDSTTLRLKASKSAKQPFVTLEEIEIATESGGSGLKDLFAKRSGRSAPAIQNDMAKALDDGLKGRLLTSCRGDEELARRITPNAALIELDAWGYPLVHPKGAFVVGLGQDRRGSGSHYTPKSLTEKIVEETLTPVTYIGPAEGHPREEWQLKSPEDILELKVCDPAMGSGAFLVQVCRWLSDRLVEAWSAAEEAGERFDVEGRRPTGPSESTAELLPQSPEERSIVAKRLIAEKCLYGVDLNPLAVELAKLSLWLTTLSKGHPFGFLDHNLRTGNSLLGIEGVDQVIELSMKPDSSRQGRLFGRNIRDAVERAMSIRLRLREIPIRDIEDVKAMEGMDRESRDALQLPNLLADALVGIELSETSAPKRKDRADELADLADEAADGDGDVRSSIWDRAASDLATDAPSGSPRKPFHWPLEFPEVFGRENGGFDAIVGNPPFSGGKKIRERSGKAFRDFIVRNVAEGRTGSADFVAYFFLSSYQHLRVGGGFGLLAVNTISEGDTRQVGLEPMLKVGAVIHAAYPNEAWPGKAAVVTSRVHVHKGEWSGNRSLMGRSAPYISAFLSGREEWSPQRLNANKNIAFQGSIVLGKGFVLEPDNAQRMLDDDPRNAEVLFPYLNGKDLNSDPEQQPSRWVINFWDWSEERARDYKAPYEWIMARVYPEHMERSSTNSYQDIMNHWWQFWRPRAELYHAIGRGEHFENHPEGWDPEINPLDKVLVYATAASKYSNFSFLGGAIIFSHAVGVIASNDFTDQIVLSTSIHNAWAFQYAGRMKQDLRYAPSNCLENFPFPETHKLDCDIEKLHTNRSSAMNAEQKGLTKLYNDLHSPDIDKQTISNLRDIQCDVDIAVRGAYGWGDLDLQHDFHEVDYLPENDNVRFTISEEARIEVLRRLSDLNMERYDEEVAQGQHDEIRGKKKAKRRKKSDTSQSILDV
jgi:hypothetical protein